MSLRFFVLLGNVSGSAPDTYYCAHAYSRNNERARIELLSWLDWLFSCSFMDCTCLLVLIILFNTILVYTSAAKATNRDKKTKATMARIANRFLVHPLAKPCFKLVILLFMSRTLMVSFFCNVAPLCVFLPHCFQRYCIQYLRLFGWGFSRWHCKHCLPAMQWLVFLFRFCC